MGGSGRGIGLGGGVLNIVLDGVPRRVLLDGVEAQDQARIGLLGGALVHLTGVHLLMRGARKHARGSFNGGFLNGLEWCGL